MAKDPAFLFYSKDWIEGTMEMTPEEKGVYIDLLVHQHQKGSLPQETKRLCKLVGLSESEFLPIWGGLKSKFTQTEDNRLHNQKLTTVVTERLETGQKNKIIGTLASVVRLSKKPDELKKIAKQGFRFEDFLPFINHSLTEKVTEWFTERLSSLEDVNANANEDANINRNRGEVFFNVEELVLKNQIEFERICMTTYKSPDVAKNSLRKYHLFLEEKEQYPKTKKALFAGFEKWLMTDKTIGNGKQGNHSVGRTLNQDTF